MAQVTITINSREYAIACEDGQEFRIIQLANMLEQKAKALTENTGRINENMLLAMIGILLADEITELKKNATSNTNSEAQNEQLKSIDADFASKIISITKEINSIAQQINS